MAWRRRTRKARDEALLIAVLSVVALFVIGNNFRTLIEKLAISLIVLSACVGLVIICIVLLIQRRSKQQRVLRLQALQLANVDQMSGVEFEQYVAALLETRGFNVIITPQSGDAGVDIVAQRGNDRYAVQAKRYAHHKRLGAGAVQEVVTGRIVPKYDCNKTMVVTTAYFGPTAHMLGTLHNCELVDRDILADWISEFQTVHS